MGGLVVSNVSSLRLWTALIQHKVSHSGSVNGVVSPHKRSFLEVWVAILKASSRIWFRIALVTLAK